MEEIIEQTTKQEIKNNQAKKLIRINELGECGWANNLDIHTKQHNTAQLKFGGEITQHERRRR